MMANERLASDILADAFSRASVATQSVLADSALSAQVEAICRSSIGAGVRLLLACALAKTCQPNIDIRKPFTELGEGSYSGRAYDEQYVTSLILAQQLPCNVTTAFLTPALRTKAVLLTAGTNLGGRDRSLYDGVIAIFDRIEQESLQAERVLVETLRLLLQIKRERAERITSLLEDRAGDENAASLSAEEIVSLIAQHLALPNAARLPVLVITAAYRCAESLLQEQVLPLQAHNAADQRTGAMGDVEIALRTDGKIVTVYEMKMKRVRREDIDGALQKLGNATANIDHYVFITTEPIDIPVQDYAQTLYRQSGGTEFVVLDCIGFLRHFLHFFHRIRVDFLNAYQELVLNEPESAVRHSLKEAFLALRRAVESGARGESAQDIS